MTNFEKEILDLLKEDARLSAKKIAAMLGREEKEIEDCIRKLEKEGAIVKYTADSGTEAVYSTYSKTRC